MIEQTVKKCGHCGQSKGLWLFPREFRSPDGRNRICKVCVNEFSRQRYWKKYGNGETRPLRHNQQALLRDLIIATYGPVCVCCGETDRGFLTIDHIGGGGNEHARRAGSQHRMYIEIISEGFPKDKYRVLCWNCNAVRRYGAICPHTQLDIGSLLAGMAC